MENKPTKSFKAGAVCASIFENEKQSADGRSYTLHRIVMDRSYKDQHDQWQKTHGLSEGDLPKAILVLQKAYEYLALHAAEDKVKEEAAEEIV